MMPSRLDQQGLTLVEMLVTALVGALVLVAVGTSIGTITQTQSRIDAYEQAQETLRFTTSLLDTSLRTAKSVKQVKNKEITLNRAASGRLDSKTGKEVPSRSCVGTSHKQEDGVWQERFYFEKDQDKDLGRLNCQLLDKETQEVLAEEAIAYGLKAFEWKVAVYSPDQKRLWEEADNQDTVIAIKAELTLEEPNMDFSHTWVLRTFIQDKIRDE